MDDSQRDPLTSRESQQVAPSIEVRGLGFALTAAALRTLLDPATRDQAEVVLDLSALSVRLPADAAREMAKRVMPDIALELSQDEMIVGVPAQPRVRLSLPGAGVQLRVDAEGLWIGGDEPGGA